MAASVAAWLVASAAGSAAARGLFELGTAPYWGVLPAAVQGLVLRRRGIPFMRWLIWSAGGWAVAALLGTRLISAAVHGVAALASGYVGTDPGGRFADGCGLGHLACRRAGALRPHMPAPLTWIPLNAPDSGHW